MPVNVREVKQALLIAATTGSPEQQAAAKEALARLEGGTAPAPASEITEPTKIGNITVSATYARELQKMYGSLGSDEAIKAAAGRRLIDAASMSDKSKFLETFPEEEAFYDSATAQVKAFWDKLDAEVARLRAERKQAKEKTSRPTPLATESVPVQQGEYVEPQEMTVVERLAAAKQLLGK